MEERLSLVGLFEEANPPPQAEVLAEITTLEEISEFGNRIIYLPQQHLYYTSITTPRTKLIRDAKWLNLQPICPDALRVEVLARYLSLASRQRQQEAHQAFESMFITSLLQAYQ